ncbi:MAG: hypothetical protein H0V51_22620 [Chloroflexi bacterium]|nr:hypothetical protein [Chloroflexota bacterium]
MIARFASSAPLADLAVGARFLWGLPAFLRHPVSPAATRAILRRRLEHREADFLGLARQTIYGYPPSPYRQLLRLAGCEYGDLERLVTHDGVEGALGDLCRRGVYLTVDELKGRSPAVRGSATVAVDPLQLRNPSSTTHLPSQTSGSRGARSMVPIDLAFVRDWAVTMCLDLHARGGSDWLIGRWSVPGGESVAFLLLYAGFGTPPVRWFTQVDPAAPGLHWRYRWSVHAMRWGGTLAGMSLPRPEYVPLDDPMPIALWMAEVLRGGSTPCLVTYTSAAVRICQAALADGLDLRGARLILIGEPITAARLATIRRAGADAIPHYGSVEAGLIGGGCLDPEAPDDVHLYQDLLALIQPRPGGEPRGAPARGLLISSLRPTASLILLNVSLGDRAEMVRRACGCPLEQLGWTTHLHTLRSYEKLTAGGMTFLDTDLIRVLDESLPARFGGGPTDYQLVEEEGGDGRPRLRLLVHPKLGPLDADGVADQFLAAIGAGSGAERVMALQWREAGFLQVDRQPPRSTVSGKILHLHQER